MGWVRRKDGVMARGAKGWRREGGRLLCFHLEL